LKIKETGTYSVQISNEYGCLASSDYFYAEELLSLRKDGSSTLQQLDVYPNPATSDVTSRLTLNELAATSFTIYDFLGRVLITRNTGLANTQITETISIDKLPSGTYLVSVKANDEIITRRLIKH
jgi:hypothetical protein